MDEKWVIDKESAEEVKSDVTDQYALKKWKKYESDVTDSPFFHPKPKRIKKLAGSKFPPGAYRYRNDPLRVVYYPQKGDRTIFTLGAGSASNISYKKRSS